MADCAFLRHQAVIVRALFARSLSEDHFDLTAAIAVFAVTHPPEPQSTDPVDGLVQVGESG
jgi:hypothetical protein